MIISIFSAINLTLSVISLFYFILLDKRLKLYSRFIPIILSFVFFESLFSLLSFHYFSQHPTFNIIMDYIIILPLFGYTALFFFLSEMILKKRIKLSYIILYSLLPFSIAAINLYIVHIKFISAEADILLLSTRLILNSIMSTLYFLVISYNLFLTTKKEHNTYSFYLYFWVVLFLFSWIAALLATRTKLANISTGYTNNFSLYVIFESFLTISLYFYIFKNHNKSLEVSVVERQRKFIEKSLQGPLASDFYSDETDAVEQADTKELQKDFVRIVDLNEEILNFFEEQPDEYLKPSFNIDRLANLLKAKRHQISKVFSDEINTSFPKYLNEKRIKHACNIIDKQMGDVNISKLSEQCGYKSRTSFYNNFQKVTGMQLTEYMDKIKS